MADVPEPLIRVLLIGYLPVTSTPLTQTQSGKMTQVFKAVHNAVFVFITWFLSMGLVKADFICNYLSILKKMKTKEGKKWNFEDVCASMSLGGEFWGSSLDKAF